MAAGISISEDPNFRFAFKPNGAEEFRGEAEDTAGKTFSGAWPAARDGA
ncbi:MAG TPA: thiosulfate oxidation carrier complex protein SoxZ [Roseiarcus sp.]|nr:thiosulfate oxidation carrier complex protein SoxZ [Roseiarcus sp.]